MSEIQTIELTKAQRDLLLRGLRFVRSSALLEMRVPSPEVDADRSDQLQKIGALADQLNGSRSAKATAKV